MKFTMIKVLTATILALALFSGCAQHTSSLPQSNLQIDLEPGQSLGINSVPNLRDLGGYKTSSGAVVRRGLVYRSATFNPISPEDIKKLEQMRLKNIYDLRTTPEVKAKPDQVPPGVQYHQLNILADSKSNLAAEIGALLHKPKKANVRLGDGKIDTLLIEGYREFVSLPSAREYYRTLFLSLADPKKLPAVFHCTSGKDRTGWTTAALLTLLGVPEETVMADFLRSNEYTLPQAQQTIDSFAAAGGDPAILTGLFGVKAEYLEASFDEMQKQYGNIEEYFAEGLGIDVSGQMALRDLLLEKVE